jgi:DNA (cytosine-5)-methyltransferase 1
VTSTGSTRIASLCSGYGGLEIAIRAGLGGQVVVGAENDTAAATVFEHHHPGVPNLGDVTKADWQKVRELYRPNVIAAGFPCTDISNAGPRIGIHGKRSGIWKNIVEAVRVLRPRLLFLENVAAIRSRGLDVVAGDLAQIGYDARWTCLRAGDAEIGAPHNRYRWFAFAHPAAADPDDSGRNWRCWDVAEAQGRHEPANPGDPSLNLLPTPKASDGPHGGPNQRDTQGRYYLPGMAVRLDRDWVSLDGVDYGPAIRRWEGVVGRRAPEPTEPGTRGNRRLSPAFAEWLMGLDAGHVTGLGLKRPDELKIIGNGVVPQQAHYAYGVLLGAHRRALAVPR